MTHVPAFRFLLCALLCGHASPVNAQQPSASPPQRPFRVADQFEVEELHPESVTLSPDGQAVAFTKWRPANRQITNSLLISETRSDVWVQDGPGRPARNLTKGAVDSSGWWHPRWSPDGQRLAFLSSRGGTVRLWVWERSTNQVRQVSSQDVDFEVTGNFGAFAFEWLDVRRIISVGLPEGERATPMGSYFPTNGGRPVERIETAWAKARRGEVTVSDIGSLEFKSSPRRVLVTDVVTGTGEVVATAQQSIQEPSLWLAPGGRFIAVRRPAPSEYGLQSIYMGNLISLDIRATEGKPVRLAQQFPVNVVTTTLRWSYDGTELAFFALGDGIVHPEVLYPGGGAREVRWPEVASKEYPGHLYRVSLRTGRVERVNIGDIDLGRAIRPPQFEWTASGEFLFRASRRSKRPATDLLGLPEWLVLGRGGRTRPLVNDVKDAKMVPVELEAVNGGTAFVGRAAGDLWRIDPVKGSLMNLTARLGPPVLQSSSFEDTRRQAHLVVSTGEPKSDTDRMWVELDFPLSFADYYVLDPDGGAVRLQKPAPHATLVAFATASKTAVYRAENRTGTFLWRKVWNGPAEQLVATNTFWRSIAKPDERIIEYTTLSGEVMKAKLTLPYGYQPGQRMPLVIGSDIGYTAENAPTVFQLSPGAPPSTQEEIYAAAGYAYMFTSMPTRTGMDEVGRANLLLGPNGVIPAVDEVIRLGIADPDRLFLMGGSSMGYGVFGLVTQTPRFRAAVASAGWVDQVTYALSIGLAERYSDNPFLLAYMGGAYSNVSLPFWRNGDHLRRNSPLQYVDRVQTPLMIVHGDLDPVHITEPEMFFKALVVQRKPARFVRYWGEGHSIMTPANDRDRWQRVLAWFDEWGDISRDVKGDMIFEGGRVKSRHGQPPLTPADYARFPLFGPGGAALGRSGAAAK